MDPGKVAKEEQMRRKRGRASYSPIPCKRLEIRQDDTHSLRSHPSPFPGNPNGGSFPCSMGYQIYFASSAFYFDQQASRFSRGWVIRCIQSQIQSLSTTKRGLSLYCITARSSQKSRKEEEERRGEGTAPINVTPVLFRLGLS